MIFRYDERRNNLAKTIIAIIKGYIGNEHMAGGKFQALNQAATPLLQGAAPVEEGFSVQCFSLKPVEMPSHLIPNYSVVIHLSSPISVEWSQGRRTNKTLLFPGDVSFHSIGELPGFCLMTEAQVLEISLSPVLVQQVLQDDTPSPLRELKNIYGISDPQIQHTGMALRADREAGCPTGRLFGECLTAGLITHIFSQYRAKPYTAPASSAKLSQRDHERIRDYIYAHLVEDVTLNALASLTQYSPHYFTLLFKEAFGSSPHQYIIQLRVQEACRLLAVSTMPLIEIAYCTGFANQSHFSLCFKRLVGTTPRQYREAIHRSSSS